MDKKITIVKVSGIVKIANLPDGRKIIRNDEDKYHIPELSTRGYFRAASYDNHFTYYDPKAPRQSPKLMCTCGSVAVVVGYDVYKRDATPSSDGAIPGSLIVCLNHTTFGRHADGTT